MKKHIVASVSVLFTIILVLGATTGVQATISMIAGIRMDTSTPAALAYDSGKGEIFVALANYQAVSVISDKTNEEIVNVTVGQYPAGLAYNSAKNEIFVSNYNSGTVSVISDSNNTVVKTIKVGQNPDGLAYDSGLGEVFVANFGSNTVSIISDSTNKVVANVTVGNYPTGVAYDSVQGKVFVTNSNLNQGTAGKPADNTVSVILDSNNKVVANVTVGASPSGVACDSIQGKVFVTNINDGTVSVISDKNYVVMASVKPPAGGGLGILSPSIVYDSGVGAIFVIHGLSIFAISDSNNTVVGTVPDYSSYANYLAYDSGKGEIFASYTAGKAAIGIISDGSGSSTPTPSPSPSPSPSSSPSPSPISSSPPSGGGGVPGYPYESIILGIVMAVSILWVIRTFHKIG